MWLTLNTPLEPFSTLNENRQQIQSQSCELQIFVMFSHLCASLQKTKNSDFRIPANINSGKSQFVCQIVIILFYKLNTISQINTCHKPLHAAASGPHAQNEYLKIKKKKKTKQTVEVSYLLNSFLKHEVC